MRKKKQQRAVVWLAYCRGAGRVVSYVIGEGKEAAIQLYKQVKSILATISCIYTDANSCYGAAFAEHQVKEAHITTKAQRHLVESSNSQLRDNMARFNRRSKRFFKILANALLYLAFVFSIKIKLIWQYIVNTPPRGCVKKSFSLL